MKLPNKFEFTTLTGTHTATLDGEGFVNVIWCKGHNNGDIDWRTCSLQEAECWVSGGGWIITKDLTLPKLKYPHKFSFTHGSTTNKYDMTYTGFLDYWYCTEAGKNPTKHSSQYNSVEIEGHFNRGTWKVVSEGGESVPSERELVLPFTFESADKSWGVYTMEQGTDVDGLTCSKGDWRSAENLYTKEQAKHAIKNGEWRVLSAGPQEPAAERRGEAECRCKPVEAPTSNDKTVSTISIKVDAKEAVERANELTAALENLAEDYLSVAEAQKEFNKYV